MPEKFDVIKAQEEREKRDVVRSMKKENEELLRDRKTLVDQLKFFQTADRRKVHDIPRPKRSTKRREATVLTLLSDIHIEERITKSATSGLNEYNPDIASRRVRKYFQNLMKLTENNRRDVEINDITICLLGDNMHGFIHDEYVSTNYMTPVEASIFALEELEAGLRYIVDHGKFKNINVVCKVGNHSRTTKKIYSESELKSSYEYMIYKILQRTFEGQIKFTIDESYFTYFTIYDKIVRAEHGHAFKYAGGIGGIFMPLMRHLHKTHTTKKFDLAVMGYWHQFESMSRSLINGSVCGFNAWNMKSGFDFQPPIQQFQLVDSQRGFTVNSKIFVE
jgi:predicted metallopeptidase